VHTSGCFTARRLVVNSWKFGYDGPLPGKDGSTADVLLRVHRSYLPVLRDVLDDVHAMAHITGGGLPGNLDRALPSDLDAAVNTRSWDVPNVFRVLEEAGNVPRAEMFRAFNMGVGMVVVCDPSKANTVIEASLAGGIPAWMLGHIGSGAGMVRLVED